MSAPPPTATPAGSVRGYVGWLVFERIARGAMSLVVLGAMGRQLGPGAFGELNTAVALVAAFMPLTNLGLDTFMIRDLMAAPAQTGAVLGTAFGLRAATGLLCSLALALWAGLVGVPVKTALLVPVALVLLWQAGEVTDLWFRQRMFSRTTVLVRLGVVFAGAVVNLGLAAANAGPAAYAWVISAHSLVFVVALTLTLRGTAGGGDRWRWEPARARAWLRAGWGFVLSAAIAGVAFRFDQLAVRQMLGPVAAGNYFAASRLLELPFFLAAAVATALLPTLAEAQSDPARAARRLGLSFEAAAAVAWLAALSATALGPWLVPLVFGAAYAPAVTVLVICSWGNLALFTGMVREQHLSLRAAPGTQAVLAVCTLAGKVAGCLILIPKLGLAGGALAFAGTQAVVGLVLPWFFSALRPCVAPQTRALLLPLRPRRWAGLWRELV